MTYDLNDWERSFRSVCSIEVSAEDGLALIADLRAKNAEIERLRQECRAEAARSELAEGYFNDAAQGLRANAERAEAAVPEMRERCAKVCDDEFWLWGEGIARTVISDCAKAIRALPLPNETAEEIDQTKFWTFGYKNYRGQVDVRQVVPLSVRFGSTKWHPEPQWLLRGFDIAKQAEREYAMDDICVGPPPQSHDPACGGDESDAAWKSHNEYASERERALLNDSAARRTAQPNDAAAVVERLRDEWRGIYMNANGRQDLLSFGPKAATLDEALAELRTLPSAPEPTPSPEPTSAIAAVTRLLTELETGDVAVNTYGQGRRHGVSDALNELRKLPAEPDTCEAVWHPIETAPLGIRVWVWRADVQLADDVSQKEPGIWVHWERDTILLSSPTHWAEYGAPKPYPAVLAALGKPAPAEASSAPGIDWKLSAEAQAALDAIDASQRSAALNLAQIICGKSASDQGRQP